MHDLGKAEYNIHRRAACGKEAKEHSGYIGDV
jgi:hypothetical protein